MSRQGPGIYFEYDFSSSNRDSRMKAQQGSFSLFSRPGWTGDLVVSGPQANSGCYSALCKMAHRHGEGTLPFKGVTQKSHTQFHSHGQNLVT